jgi:phosphoribosylaminoimidazole-succinocarboxamide synthase
MRNNMGSVKDLYVIDEPTIDKSGVGQFRFSDRYSVFDWGEMPDLLTDKGKALCVMGAFFFEQLEFMNMHTHYQGLVHDNKVKRLADLTEPVDTMQVDLVRVIKPNNIEGKYDYSIYNSEEKNILIPLEVIYRNSLPDGSSVFRRLEKGSLRLEDIGLSQMPEPNDILAEPLLDVSTKLEVTDRYMDWQEAQKISAISDSEMKTLKDATKEINSLISNRVEKVGLKNEDGKVEFAYDINRNLMLVDILGTPDECRFTFEGMQVSKQVARNYYRKTDWYDQIERAKEQDRHNWKKMVDSPPKLPPRFFELISQLYQSVCNEVTEREWFNVPSLKSILIGIQEQIKK